MGAEFIVSPCAWAVPADHDNIREPYGALWRDCYGRVAREFGIWIAGASNVGPVTAGAWAGRKCIGCSLIVGPDGEPVAQGPYGEDAEALLQVTMERRPRAPRAGATP
jgi:predicted amidohydrolase